MTESVDIGPGNLLREAEAVRGGTESLREFLVNLDWALSRARARGGPWAPQICEMVTDALEDAVEGAVVLGPEHAPVLAEVAILAANHGGRPETVRVAHDRLTLAGLRRRPVPHPRSRKEQLPDAPIAPATRRIRSRPTAGDSMRSTVQGLRVIGLGWAIVISLLAGILGGNWIDGQLGSAPFFTLAGLVLGGLGAFHTVRTMIRETRRPL